MTDLTEQSHPRSPGCLVPGLNSCHLGSGFSWFDSEGKRKRQQKKIHYKSLKKFFSVIGVVFSKLPCFLSELSSTQRREKSVASKRKMTVEALHIKIQKKEDDASVFIPRYSFI